MNVIKPKEEKLPERVLIFSEIGLGKSTLASTAPNPIFINLEDRIDEINADRLEVPESYDQFHQQLIEVYKEEHDYKTIVIDTIDALEALIYKKVCEENSVGSISDINFGGGYEQSLTIFRKVVDALNKLRLHKKMKIIILAHSHVKTYNNPLGQDYDRISIKLREKNAAVITERCDIVGYLHINTYTSEVDKGFGSKKTKVASTQERVFSCYPSAAFEAKNSYRIDSDIVIPIENGYDKITEAIEVGREKNKKLNKK